jgi:hypothetical protein
MTALRAGGGIGRAGPVVPAPRLAEFLHQGVLLDLLFRRQDGIDFFADFEPDFPHVFEEIGPKLVDPVVIFFEDFVNPGFLILREAEVFLPFFRRRAGSMVSSRIEKKTIGKNPGRRARGKRQQ